MLGPTASGDANAELGNLIDNPRRVSVLLRPDRDFDGFDRLDSKLRAAVEIDID